MINKIVFAGKDASRALGMSSVKPEDVSPKWEDLSDKEKGVLEDWYVFPALALVGLCCVVLLTGLGSCSLRRGIIRLGWLFRFFF